MKKFYLQQLYSLPLVLPQLRKAWLKKQNQQKLIRRKQLKSLNLPWLTRLLPMTLKHGSWLAIFRKQFMMMKT